MRQSLFAWFGAVLLLVPAVFAVAFGWRAVLDAPEMLVYAFAGVTVVLGARVAAVEVGPVRVSWRHLVGVSWLLIALANLVEGVVTVLDGTGSTAMVVSTGGLLLASFCIAFFGVEIARDGRHFQVTGDAERVLSL